MNKLTFTTAMIMAMTASSVFAHHPVSEMVDADTYELINENVADTPHIDMVVDDMGSAMDQAVSEQTGAAVDMAEASVDTDVAMDATSSIDTIDLMETVANSLAQ
jgi:hypothetical protein